MAPLTIDEVLVYFILLPVRRKVKRQREVTWLAFGQENNHQVNDGSDQSIFRTPRAGLGEDEDKADRQEAAESYQMHNAMPQHTYYGHFGGEEDNQKLAQHGTSIVGEHPNDYAQAYGQYYHQGYAPYIPSGSPEMSATVYGPQVWPLHQQAPSEGHAYSHGSAGYTVPHAADYHSTPHQQVDVPGSSQCVAPPSRQPSGSATAVSHEGVPCVQRRDASKVTDGTEDVRLPYQNDGILDSKRSLHLVNPDD